MPRTRASVSASRWMTANVSSREWSSTISHSHSTAELRHRLREPRVQRLEVGGFVERRREDREHRRSRHALARRACSDATTRSCSSSVIW